MHISYIYYDLLSADEKAEQCGWLKDKFGLSWQIIPKEFDELLKNLDAKKKEKVKRINIDELKAVSES